MKKTIFLVALAGLVAMQSCEPKESYIRVTNKISNVKLSEIQWGGVSFYSTDLLPGESTELHRVVLYEQKLPAKYPVTFRMTANQKTVYLQTVEQYTLEKESNLTVVLEDSTPVQNPL